MSVGEFDHLFPDETKRMWKEFARSQATELMVIIEPGGAHLVDLVPMPSIEQAYQDLLDREQEALEEIVVPAMEYLSKQMSPDTGRAEIKTFMPRADRPAAGAVGIAYEMVQAAREINWDEETIKWAVYNGVPPAAVVALAYIRGKLRKLWQSRGTAPEERRYPPLSPAFLTLVCFHHASEYHPDLRPRFPDMPDPDSQTDRLPHDDSQIYTFRIPAKHGHLVYEVSHRAMLHRLTYERFFRTSDLNTTSWDDMLQNYYKDDLER